MKRQDGSIKSANIPSWDQRAEVRDFGLYRGVITKVIYTDNPKNDSGGVNDPNEVVYDIMIVGGDRDGQIFENARLLRDLGGWDAFEEKTLKAVEGITKQDPTSLAALGDPTIKSLSRFNGDVVYIQFLNGSIRLPVIIGMAHHQVAEPEASEDEGPRYKRRNLGISVEVTKDGEYSWTKDNGAFVPFAPNTNDPLYPYVSQFAPLPGQDGAVTLKLGNKFDFNFGYNTGLNVNIDGIADTYKFTTAAGATYTLDGIQDSHALDTKAGATFALSGIKDALSIDTSAGLAVKIDGLQDAFTATTTGGAALQVSGTAGVSLKDSLGDSLDLKTGAATLTNAAGVKLDLQKTGFIKLGNNSGDFLKDVVQALIQSLAGASYSGFGAPGSNVADLVQLLVKCQLFTGG